MNWHQSTTIDHPFAVGLHGYRSGTLHLAIQTKAKITQFFQWGRKKAENRKNKKRLQPVRLNRPETLQYLDRRYESWEALGLPWRRHSVWRDAEGHFSEILRVKRVKLFFSPLSAHSTPHTRTLSSDLNRVCAPVHNCNAKQLFYEALFCGRHTMSYLAHWRPLSCIVPLVCNFTTH